MRRKAGAGELRVVEEEGLGLAFESARRAETRRARPVCPDGNRPSAANRNGARPTGRGIYRTMEEASLRGLRHCRASRPVTAAGHQSAEVGPGAIGEANGSLLEEGRNKMKVKEHLTSEQIAAYVTNQNRLAAG